MCDFKPGDEVEKYRLGTPGTPHRTSPFSLPLGFRGVVREVLWHPTWGPGVFGLLFEGVPGDINRTHYAANFRKVIRRTDKRDLTEWLAQPTEVEEPKRAPAKKRERA